MTLAPLSARRLAEMVSLGERLLAIELVIAAQAVDLRGKRPLGAGTAPAHERVRRVVLPGALPGFLVGLRISVAVAWLLLVFAEQINASSGIGYLMIRAQTWCR